MRILLGLMICATTVSVVFNNGLTLGPGLSVKNALAYLAALMLVFEVALGRPLKFSFGGMQATFAVFVLYAFMSLLYVAEVVRPERYDLIGSAIVLKSTLMDWAVFFMVFFYGTRTVEEVERLIKIILISIGVGNLYTIAVMLGVPAVGAEVIGTDNEAAVSRVMGVFGHANETGSLIAAFLPVYLAAAESSKGFRKGLWISLMTSSAIVMFITGSRGALVALFVGCVWAAVLCRRYLSLQRTMYWITRMAAILVPITITVGIRYWDMVVGRFTSAQLSSASDVSSGRTDVWISALNKLATKPVTIVTGYGWNVWDLMGFQFIAHNQYLSEWFELGLIGCLAFVLIFQQNISNALRALQVADPKARRYLMATVFCILIWCCSLMFGTMFIPWFYVWPFLGLAMRYAALMLEVRRPADPVASQPDQSREATKKWRGRTIAATTGGGRRQLDSTPAPGLHRLK